MQVEIENTLILCYSAGKPIKTNFDSAKIYRLSYFGQYLKSETS